MSVRASFPLMLVGCGRLADGDYVGEPLFSLTGNVVDDGSSRDLDLRVALFWANDGAEREEQAVVVTTRFPAEYTMSLYAWPPDEARFDAQWDPGHRYAIGIPLVYADRNRDQQWNLGEEPVLGGSERQVVLFSESSAEVLSADGQSSPILEGFSRIWSDANTSICGSTNQPNFQVPQAEEPTDLSVGLTWSNHLYDWDCDGEYEEWELLCPNIEAFDDWCRDPANAADVCRTFCTQDPDPGTSPDQDPASGNF